MIEVRVTELTRIICSRSRIAHDLNRIQRGSTDSAQRYLQSCWNEEVQSKSSGRETKESMDIAGETLQRIPMHISSLIEWGSKLYIVAS